MMLGIRFMDEGSVSIYTVDKYETYLGQILADQDPIWGSIPQDQQIQ